MYKRKLKYFFGSIKSILFDFLFLEKNFAKHLKTKDNNTKDEKQN
jgi:hypothetical protein